jgi:hypothetical protein
MVDDSLGHACFPSFRARWCPGPIGTAFRPIASFIFENSALPISGCLSLLNARERKSIPFEWVPPHLLNLKTCIIH